MPDFATLTNNVRTLFVALFPIIQSGEWTGKDWTDEQKAELNKFMHLLNDVYNDKLRKPYDRTIWDGHKTGKVAKTLGPVRAETIRKDSTKSEQPTADALFDTLAGIEATAEVAPTE